MKPSHPCADATSEEWDAFFLALSDYRNERSQELDAATWDDWIDCVEGEAASESPSPSSIVSFLRKDLDDLANEVRVHPALLVCAHRPASTSIRVYSSVGDRHTATPSIEVESALGEASHHIRLRADRSHFWFSIFLPDEGPPTVPDAFKRADGQFRERHWGPRTVARHRITISGGPGLLFAFASSRRFLRDNVVGAVELVDSLRDGVLAQLENQNGQFFFIETRLPE